VGEFNVGDAVTGKVTKVMTFGLFIDVGASTNALAPTRMLAKELTEYSVGDELDDLTVQTIEAELNRFTVGQKSGADDAAGRISIDDLKQGSQIPGVVRKVMDYGVFVDIGMGRRDALLPNSLLGEGRKPGDFEENQQIEVYVDRIDKVKQNVTLNMEEPQDRAGRYGFDGDTWVPPGDMMPDPKYWALRCDREEIIDDEPVPWKEWAEKYPGLIKFSEKELELYYCSAGYGFHGLKAAHPSQVNYIPIPMHLRKPDAGPPEFPAFDFDDYEIGYDHGIKPEIHVKYRQPPFNDPNWVWRRQERVEY